MDRHKLRHIKPLILAENPQILPMLRMSTCPPIARDRLIGLAGVSPNLVKVMELDNKIPPRMDKARLAIELQSICDILERMADRDIFIWLESGQDPSVEEVYRAATIVADRLCGAVADPIIRNAQEKRQLLSIKSWIEQGGYKQIMSGSGLSYKNMEPGTFSFRLNVPINLENGKKINLPVDCVIVPMGSIPADFPLLIEAKTAGDFTNTNKRRKEEAVKMMQLRNNYGDKIKFVLFLCGYFDSGYLGYEAAEGIDWVWEHRIDDLSKFGL